MAFDVDWTRPPGQRITGLPSPRGVDTYQAMPPVPRRRHELAQSEPERRPSIDAAADIAQALIHDVAAHQRQLDTFRTGLQQLLRHALADLDALDQQDGARR